MAKTQAEVRSFLRKFYRFLEQGHSFEFKRSNVYRGYIIHDEEQLEPASVTLDHSRQLVPTLIHEAIHYIYPEFSETQVLVMEREIVSGLTDRQVRNIIKKFANVL